MHCCWLVALMVHLSEVQRVAAMEENPPCLLLRSQGFLIPATEYLFSMSPPPTPRGRGKGLRFWLQTHLFGKHLQLAVDAVNVEPEVDQLVDPGVA